MPILKFLGLNKTGPVPADSAAQTENVREIGRRLHQLPPDQARYIAAFAYLLSRAAEADLDTTPEETAMMERIVMEKGGLPEGLALLVVEIARAQSRLFGHTEDYLVIQEFERLATRKQKLALLECLFAVTAADQDITGVENAVVKQIASKLKLSQSQYLAAQSKFREYLGALKPSRGRT